MSGPSSRSTHTSPKPNGSGRGGARPLRLGFACAWEPDRAKTWSHTPLSLATALQGRDDLSVVDIDLGMSRLTSACLRLSALRMHDGRLRSDWRASSMTTRLQERILRRRAGRHRSALDAVLCIGEHGALPVPQWVYQDYCFAQAEHDIARLGAVPSYDEYAPSTLRRRADHQASTYRSLAGVFTMSRYNGDFLVAAGLCTRDQVVVVPPGINVDVAVPTQADADRLHPRRRRRLVFVGREFFRKGGDLVVRAFNELRRHGNTEVELIVAGPATWPLPTPIPEGISFLGNAPHSAVRAALATADVLCLPSRFEAFGIAVIEALAAGVPVLGRNDFAMPEMIRHGDNGILIEDDDVDMMAAYLHAMTMDDSMRRRTIEQAADVRAYYSWERAASTMVRTMRRTLLGAPINDPSDDR